MITLYTRVTFALVSFIFISPGAYAQFTKEAVVQLLDDALRTHLSGVLPHHFCPCNNCMHTYNGDIKIIRTGRTAATFQPVRIEERITVWGNAAAIQSSTFLGSSTVINFYAEFREIQGIPDLVKLKWKQNDCMQYVMLLNKENEVFEPNEIQKEMLASLDADKKGKTLEEIIAEDALEFPSLYQQPVNEALASQAPPDSVKNILEGALSALVKESQPAASDVYPHDPHTVARIGSIAASGVAAPEAAAPEALADTNASPVDEPRDEATGSPRVAVNEPDKGSGPMLASLEPQVLAFEANYTPDDPTRDPVTYLTIDYKLQEKPAQKSKKKNEQDSDETATHTLAGTILSKASETKIKDAVLELAFYTKTDTKIASETRPLYEFFEPGEPTFFSFEVTPPPFTAYASITIVQAVWVEK